MPRPLRLTRCARARRQRRELELHIAAVVDAAPPLTAAQRDRLGVLLAPPAAPEIPDRPGEAGAARPVRNLRG